MDCLGHLVGIMSKPAIQWPPPRHLWPEGFSVHRDGWAKSYRGKTVVVSGKRLSPAEVARRFQERCELIDRGKPPVMPRGPSVTLRQLAGAFFADLERRARIQDISARHAENVISECRRFGRFIGGDKPIRNIGPAEFAAYHQRFISAKSSPYTAENIVRRIGQMFKWAVANDMLERVTFGTIWRPPPAKKRMAHRLRKEKTFAPEVIGQIYRVAPPMFRRWIELAICGGFTNSDLAGMTWSLFDGDVIDYRRRKSGEVRRVIPIPGEVLQRLKAFRNEAEPASADYADHVFLDHTGKPFDTVGRRSQSATEFARVMKAAGCHVKGRAFTGLRTTCFNELLYAPAIVRGLIIGRVPEGMSPLDWESYVERVDVEPVRAAVDAIWQKFRNLLSDVTPSVETVSLVKRRARTQSATRVRKGS